MRLVYHDRGRLSAAPGVAAQAGADRSVGGASMSSGRDYGLRMDDRAAWSAAGCVVAATCGTNAGAWAVAASSAGAHLPGWPAVVFGVMATAGLVAAVLSLLRFWPFHGLAIAPADLLDDCIRRGRAARDKIVRGGLDEWEAAREAGVWTLFTSNRLEKHHPAIADRFLLVSGDDENLSGQALIVNTIAAKLALLSSAREQV
jgi:hypothetical protein